MESERASMPTGPEGPHSRLAPAVYRRRRLAAGLGAILLLVLFVLAFRSCGGGDDPALTGEETRRLALEQDPIELTLAFTGDLLIHSPVYLRAQSLADGEGYDFAPLFEEIRPYVEGADIAFCHVETPMTPQPPTSYPIFNTPPELARAVSQTGWDVCSTASNHALDQGQEGVAATLRALERAGVEHTGTAGAAKDARAPLIVEAAGARIAYLAYTSDTNGIPLPKPYSVNLFDRERIVADARRARRGGADAVIVNLHWASEIAPEYVTEPNAAQERLARELAREAAITALVGQGPHVVQPIREVARKTVVFSEGNLISNQGADAGLAAESQDGYIAELDLVVDGDGAQVAAARYVPVWVDHSDYKVLPVGDALESGEGEAASLRASYRRTLSVVGRSTATPVPARLP